MPEWTVLPAQHSASRVCAGGHEGNFSLMSLFVLFQSAASSDGGKCNSFFFNESVERNSICVLMNIYNLKTEVFSAFIVWFIFVVFISHFIFRPQHRTL